MSSTSTTRISEFPGIPKRPSGRIRPAATLLVAIALPSLVSAEPVPTRYKLTILKVWSSDKPQKGELPAALAELVEKLKKKTGKTSFRLDGKPITATLEKGKPVKAKLPDGYEARWELSDAKGESGLRQILINPEKKTSTVRVKTSPVISTLGKIQRGGETFIAILQFEPLR